jgi:hypothetical protein
MNARNVALVIALLDAVACVAMAVALFTPPANPTNSGVNFFLGIFVILWFLPTGVPALVLALSRRAPRAALGFGLAYPALFVLAAIVVVIVF